MTIARLAVVSVILTACSVLVMSVLVKRWKLERENFRGDPIPTGYGFMLVIAAVPVYVWLGAQAGLFLGLVLGFGVLGLIDDIYGTREAGGFRGHLRLLLKGRVSTGLVKAIGGGLLSLAAGMVAAKGAPTAGILNALVISFSANTLNLLDLRPGRAVSCFWVGMLALGFVPPARSLAPYLLPVMIPALWLSVLDRSAKVMLGDAGSNVLGAVLGLAIVLSLGVPAKLVLVILMAAVNIYSEKYSISRLIENNGFLTRLDRLLGER